MLYNRWFKRSTSLIMGVPFATQYAAYTWASYPGDPTWEDMGDLTWADLQPEEGQYSLMFVKGANLYQIGLRTDTTAVGVAMAAEWQSQRAQGTLDQLFTYQSLLVDYERGAGTLTIQYPDSSGLLVDVPDVAGVVARPVSLVTKPTVRRFHSNRSGQGIGVGLKITGDIAVRKIQSISLPRSSSLSA